MSKETKASTKRPRITKEERRAKYVEIARKRRQKQRDQQKNTLTTCFHCRQQGHVVADCPLKSKSEIADTSVCYKCGSTEHALSSCPKRKGGKPTDLPFASCFMCKKMGHLISQCPQNTNGIYVNGGECRHCGSKEHLASKCPKKGKSSPSEDTKVNHDDREVEDLLEPEPTSVEIEPKESSKRKRKVVKF